MIYSLRKYLQIFLFFFFSSGLFQLNDVHGMIQPQTPVSKKTFNWESPKRLPIKFNNYAKEIVEQIGHENLKQRDKILAIRNALSSYFEHIPYIAKIKTPNFFYSLGVSLMLSLLMSLEEQKTVLFDPTNNTCAIAFDTKEIGDEDEKEEQAAYILQFRTVESANKKKRPQQNFYVLDNGKTKNVVILGIDFFPQKYYDPCTRAHKTKFTYAIEIFENKEQGRTKQVPLTSHNPIYKEVNIFKKNFFQNLYENKPNKVGIFLTRLFKQIDISKHIKLEKYYQTIVYNMIRFFGFAHTQIERCTEQGRIDILMQTNQAIYIMEFKLNGSVQKALEQITERKYASCYHDRTDLPVYSVGINIKYPQNATKVTVDVGMATYKYPEENESIENFDSPPQKPSSHRPLLKVIQGKKINFTSDSDSD